MGPARRRSAARLVAVLTSIVVVALAVAACNGGVDIDTSAVAGEDLSRSSGCGDAEVYAASEDGTWAVVVTIDGPASDIDDAGGSVERSYDLPDDEIHVALWVGHRVTAVLCTDVDDQDHEVVARWRATGGQVQVRAEPGDGVPPTPDAYLEATELTFEPTSDDTLETVYLEQVTIGPAAIGWYPG